MAHHASLPKSLAQKLPEKMSALMRTSNFFLDFTLEDRSVGTGIHGKVLACRSKDPKKLDEQFAVKTMVLSVANLESIRHHIELCPHPNIMEIKHVYCNEFLQDNCPFVLYNNSKAGMHLILVMECKKDGDLYELILSGYFNHTTETDVAAIFKEIAQGVCQIHEKGLVHGDLKAENILCEFDDAKNLHLILTDFESLHQVKYPPPLHIYTKAYVSPELLDNIERKKCKQPLKPIGFGTDIWALGVLLFILLTGEAPFYSLRREGLDYNDRLTPFFCQSVNASIFEMPKKSRPACDLLKKMLHPFPQLRISIQDVLAHPFLADS